MEILYYKMRYRKGKYIVLDRNSHVLGVFDVGWVSKVCSVAVVFNSLVDDESTFHISYINEGKLFCNQARIMLSNNREYIWRIAGLKCYCWSVYSAQNNIKLMESASINAYCNLGAKVSLVDGKIENRELFHVCVYLSKLYLRRLFYWVLTIIITTPFLITLM